MSDDNMTRAMSGEAIKISLQRLYEMQEQAMAAARLHERGHSWMNWHWVAVLNEVIDSRSQHGLPTDEQIRAKVRQCLKRGVDPRKDCPWKCSSTSEWCACRDGAVAMGAQTVAFTEKDLREMMDRLWSEATPK